MGTREIFNTLRTCKYSDNKTDWFDLDRARSLSHWGECVGLVPFKREREREKDRERAQRRGVLRISFANRQQRQGDKLKVLGDLVETVANVYHLYKAWISHSPQFFSRGCLYLCCFSSLFFSYRDYTEGTREREENSFCFVGLHLFKIRPLKRSCS